MSKGLICTIAGTKGVAMCRAMATALEKKATKLEAMEDADADALALADQHAMSGSNVAQPGDRAAGLRADAGELRFIADHIDPAARLLLIRAADDHLLHLVELDAVPPVEESYRLGRDDLRRLGLVAGY